MFKNNNKKKSVKKRKHLELNSYLKKKSRPKPNGTLIVVNSV